MKRFTKLFLLTVPVLMFGDFLVAADLSPEFGDRGIFKTGGVEISPTVFESNWNMVSTTGLRLHTGFPKRDVSSMAIAGTLPLKFTDGAVEFVAKFNTVEEGKTNCAYQFNVKPPVELKEIALSVTLPVNFYAGKMLKIDGANLKLPETFSGVRLKATRAKTLEIPTADGSLLLRGELDLLVQDNRQWKVDFFSVRIRFTPEATLNLELEKHAFRSEPVDLRQAAFTGFYDEHVGDRQGGWTDQGDNDLRMMQPGQTTFGGIRFDIIDPAKNNGKSCMVFCAPERSYFPQSATIAIDGKTFRALYLLHALAWAPRDAARIGTVELKFADGTAETVDVKAPDDLGDWYTPTNRPNGRVVWTGTNRLAYVGLYLSKYPVPERPLREIRFNSSGKAVWMVAAVSGGDDVPLPELTRSFIVQNDRWVPIANPFRIKPGSVLDFSQLTVKYDPEKTGKIVVRNGRLEPENRPGEKLRFYGVNVMHFDEIMQGKTIEEVADYITALGYNAVRLHHYDHPFCDYSDPTAPRIDTAKIKHLDRFFAELKKRGMYLCIDLFSMRNIRRGAIKEFDRDITQNEYKALIPISESARQNFEDFARSLLEHRNEYTGLAWKDDPALFAVCTVNEDNIHTFYAAAPPEIKALYRREYEKNRNGMEFNRFLTEIGLQSHRRNIEFLKSIGANALTTAVNANLYDAAFGELQSLRAAADYVDNHSYYDHGKYQQDTKRWSIDNRSDIAANAAVPRDIMDTRLWGKPFMVTEFDFCSPNHFRSEGGAIFGAYAALQDWDGVFRFCLGYRPNQDIRHFGLAGDPINMLSERIGILNFLRGDVRAATKRYALRFTPDSAVPQGFTELGLQAGIGSIAANEKLPEGVSEISAYDQSAIIPGQILEINQEAGTFRQVTPASECLIAPEGTQLAGSHARVRFSDGRSTFYIAALDGLPLTQSCRMLLLLLTDVQNSHTIFADQHHNLMLDGGRLPLLVRRGEAEVTLQRSPNAASLKLYAVALDGSRIAEMPVSANKDTIAFVLKTAIAPGMEPALAFELSQ